MEIDSWLTIPNLKEKFDLTEEWKDLIVGMKKGSIRSLARVITRVENREKGWLAAMKTIYPLCGKARVIGITGPPGSGKSTLTDKMAAHLIDRGYSVAIIAIDPSSSFSGGALLGDRLRMSKTNNLNGLFVRSMATRGATGGLSGATSKTIQILDAFGKDYILIETVGVGQDEIEVTKVADLVLLLAIPGQGDLIQDLKAGVMEIADIFIVNKADRDGADSVAMNIKTMLSMNSSQKKWVPPVLMTVATKGDGIAELIQTALDFYSNKDIIEKRRKFRIKKEIVDILKSELVISAEKFIDINNSFDHVVEQILSGKENPYSYAWNVIVGLFESIKTN